MFSPPLSNSKDAIRSSGNGNVLTGNIFIMELREEFFVCLNNEALSRVRVYLYKPFYSRERENAKLRGTILSENGEINKTRNMETSQYFRRTREYVSPGRASIIDNRTKTSKLDMIKNIVPKL